MLTAVDDAVWKALADPSRRRIVEVLEHRPATTGELITAFSDQLVRTAVMKHLDVLESAGLIQVERRGRQRWNQLREKPLQKVSGWLLARIGHHQGDLRRLKALAENKRQQSTANRNIRRLS